MQIFFYFSVKLQARMYFQYLKVHLCRLGTFLNGSNPKENAIVISKRCSLLVILVLYFISPAWYFAFVAQTPREHSESLFVVLSILVVLSWYSALIIQSEKYAELFDELNSLIGKRKLKLTDFNENILVYGKILIFFNGPVDRYTQ